MRAAALAPDGPAGSDSVDSTSGSLFERSPHARPHVSPPISRGGTLYLSPRAEPASALLLPASLGQPLLPARGSGVTRDLGAARSAYDQNDVESSRIAHSRPGGVPGGVPAVSVEGHDDTGGRVKSVVFGGCAGLAPLPRPLLRPASVAHSPAASQAGRDPHLLCHCRHLRAHLHQLGL